MIDLRPDFYNRIPSWVKNDPRRLHLFLYLLDKMDEDGYAEFSVLGYAKQAGLGREVVRRMLANLEKRTNIETICNQRRTIVFICNLERYTMPATNLQPISNQCRAFTERKERNEGSPLHPL